MATSWWSDGGSVGISVGEDTLHVASNGPILGTMSVHSEHQCGTPIQLLDDNGNGMVRRNLRRRIGRRVRDLFSDWTAIFGTVGNTDCNLCKETDDYFPYPTGRGLFLEDDEDGEEGALLRLEFERKLLDTSLR